MVVLHAAQLLCDIAPKPANNQWVDMKHPAGSRVAFADHWAVVLRHDVLARRDTLHVLADGGDVVGWESPDRRIWSLQHLVNSYY